jgi:glycosyltransferase involved in cell wall biosynthesis
VEFLGYVSDTRLREEFARCDVWVNPSITDPALDGEDISSGVIEAYSFRRPVVATSVGMSADLVQHGRTGWLVQEKDEFALSRAILDLINQPSRACLFGESGLRHLQQQFCWSTIAEQVEGLYLQAIHRLRAGHSANSRSRPSLRIVRPEAA